MDFCIMLSVICLVAGLFLLITTEDKTWSIPISALMVIFGLLGGCIFGGMKASYIEKFKKYDEKTIFYKVEYNGKPLVVINPEIKDGILSNKEITIKPEKGYTKIDREEAIDLLK